MRSNEIRGDSFRSNERDFHNAQLTTHPAIEILPLTLQLHYIAVSILQRVTKSKKIQKLRLSKNNALVKVGGANSISINLKNKLYNKKFQGFPYCGKASGQWIYHFLTKFFCK